MMEAEAKPPSSQCASPNTVLDPGTFFQEQQLIVKAKATQLYQLEPIQSLRLPAGGQVATRPQMQQAGPAQSRGIHQAESMGPLLVHHMGQGQTRARQTREQSQQLSSGTEEGAESFGASAIGPDGMKRGPWTKEEDAMLAEYVRQYGPKDWSSVPVKTKLVNRCGKSCRLRYVNHLRPNLKKEAFTDEEEQMVIELQAQMGNKWAAIAARMPGRTDNEIKNLWNTRIKKRKRDAEMHLPDMRQQQQHSYRWPQSRPQPAYSEGDSCMPPLVSVEEWGGAPRMRRGAQMQAGSLRRSTSLPTDAGAYVYLEEGTASRLSTPSASSTACPPPQRPISAASCRSRLSESTRASPLGGGHDGMSTCWSPLEEEHAMFVPQNEEYTMQQDAGMLPPDHPVETPREEQYSVTQQTGGALPLMPDQMIQEGGSPERSSAPPPNEEKKFQRRAFIEKLKLDAGLNTQGGVHWAASIEASTPWGAAASLREDPLESGTPAWTPSSGTVPSFLRASTPRTREPCPTPGFQHPFTPGSSFSQLCRTPMGSASNFDVFPSPAGYQKTVKSVTDEMMAVDDVALLSKSSF